MHPTKNSCIRFNYTVYYKFNFKNFGGGTAGVILKSKGIYVLLSGCNYNSY